jgi:hypothetical protein
VPFIAIERSDKVSDLCWDISWPAKVLPPQFDAIEVVEHPKRLKQNASTMDGQLKQTVQNMRKRALRNAAG